MWLALMLFPEVFVRIFNNDKELLSKTSWSMRIYFAGIMTIGVQISCQQTFLALGKSKISFLLAILRKVVLLVPLIFILPSLIENKLFAVFLAEPIADITAAVVTLACFMVFYKKTLSNIDE